MFLVEAFETVVGHFLFIVFKVGSAVVLRFVAQDSFGLFDIHPVVGAVSFIRTEDKLGFVIRRTENVYYGLEVFKDWRKPSGADVEFTTVAVCQNASVEDLGEVLDVDEVSAFLNVAPDFNWSSFNGLVYDIAVTHRLLDAVDVISVPRMIGIDVGHPENEPFETVHLMVILDKFASGYLANGIDAVVGHIIDLGPHVCREEVHAFLEIAVVVRNGLHEKDPVRFYSFGVFENVKSSLDVDVDVSFRMIAFHVRGKHSGQMNYGVDVLGR